MDPLTMNDQQDAALPRTLTAIAVDVAPELLATLHQTFSRGHVELKEVTPEAAEEQGMARAQACFVPLKPNLLETLSTARWFARQRTMLYGVGTSGEVGRFASAGINALVDFADELSLKAAVDTTRNLLSRQFDECSRIPIVVPVEVETETGSVQGITRNVGCGGMAVRLHRTSSLPAVMRLVFQLPGASSMCVIAAPRWYSGSLVGLQFCPTQVASSVKRWVFQFSQLGRPQSRTLQAPRGPSRPN